MSLFQPNSKNRYTLSDIRQRKADVKRKIKRTERDIKAQKDAVLSPRTMLIETFQQFDFRNIGQYVSAARQAYKFAGGIVDKIKQKYGQNPVD